MRDRPCLHQCNRPGCSPTKCLGRKTYRPEEPGHWLGRGHVDAAGRPFGWAHHMERDAIRAHLKARGRWRDARDEFTVTRIQTRLHRDRVRLGVKIGANVRVVRSTAPEAFSKEELERLCELFEGANDPVTGSIAVKTRTMLDARGGERQ